MILPAWQRFTEEQNSWPKASRTVPDTSARNAASGKTFVKRKRMSPEERHLQIVQAAVKTIATKGYWGMSLQHLADELGITEAALYHYIDSKDDLLNMALTEYYDTPDADEYNARTATITDADGHRVCFYPRYCLNILLYNLQRPEMVQLFSVLNGEALMPDHPAHLFFVGRHQRNWELVRSMHWLLPASYDEKKFYHLYTLAMSAMDGLQYRWLADKSFNLLDEWLQCSEELFPEELWAGLRDPSERDNDTDCLVPLTLAGRACAQ